MSNNTKQKPFMRVSEVADQFGLHPETIRNLIRAGELPAVKLGSARNAPLFVNREAFDAWLARQAVACQAIA